MKTKLLVGTLLAGSALFAETHVSIGIGLGGYAPPPAVVAYAPPCPGPGYTWVDGYWDSYGPRRHWHSGYWARPRFGRGYRMDRGYSENRYRGEENRYDRNPYGSQYDNGFRRR